MTNLIFILFESLFCLIYFSILFLIILVGWELISLQDLTILPTEFFRRCKTHIPSVIILPTESKTEMIRR
jgi:hypothetical protein